MTPDSSGLPGESHWDEPGSRRCYRLTPLTDEMLTTTTGRRPQAQP